jgi:3-(3-hydroxy-phenyl)propionate hydroxylase
MFQYQTYPFQKPPELQGDLSKIHDIVIVGGGPVGLTLALALAKQGIEVVLLDDNNQVSVGSRAICFAKRTLEIFDKLGVAKPMLAKGVQWNVGRIFFRENEIDRFDLSPEKSSKYPAFINLQQYYIEQFLIEAVLKEPKIEVRWLNKVVHLNQNQQRNELLIETPAGHYALKTNYLAACDGSKSTIRNLLNLQMEGERFEERFLIADFVMEADFPPERWFWFDPPFARGQSILLHKQPDNLWRLDFKLGKNAPSAIAQDKDFIRAKIKSVVGERPFELDWTSIYSFSSKMLNRFVQNRVIFVGDSAHVVSPFGARGANSGIEDADNLSWKLARILKNQANDALLETYNAERTAAAKQNIACTSQSTLFIAPPTAEGLAHRNEILEKAMVDTAFKKQINCGRLSTPSIYGKYPNCEEGIWQNVFLESGRCAKDCFMDNRTAHLIEKLPYQFTLLTLKSLDSESFKSLEINVLEVNLVGNEDLIAMYDLTEGAAYLIAPDQYILGRWKRFTTQNAIDLMKMYLSGIVYDANTLRKTEQEFIDEQVETLLKRDTNFTNLHENLYRHS